MTKEEKIKKAVAIAVAYHIEQENVSVLTATNNKANTTWNQAGKSFQLKMKRMLQHRGSINRNQA